MDQETIHLLEQIVRQTNNDVIYFVIVLALFTIPLYVVMLKGRKAKAKEDEKKLELYLKREQQLMQVVSTNTEALVALRTTQDIALLNIKQALDTSNRLVDKSLDRIHTRMDEIIQQALANRSQLELLSAHTEKSLMNQQILKDVTGNILLIVDSIPHDSKFTAGTYRPHTKGTDENE